MNYDRMWISLKFSSSSPCYYYVSIQNDEFSSVKKIFLNRKSLSQHNRTKNVKENKKKKIEENSE